MFRTGITVKKSMSVTLLLLIWLAKIKFELNWNILQLYPEIERNWFLLEFGSYWRVLILIYVAERTPPNSENPLEQEVLETEEVN